MKKEDIDDNAAMALSGLRIQLQKAYPGLSRNELHQHHVRPVLEELHRADNLTLDASELQGDALTALRKLWDRQVLVGETNTASDIKIIVDRMREKAKSEDQW